MIRSIPWSWGWGCQCSDVTPPQALPVPPRSPPPLTCMPLTPALQKNFFTSTSIWTSPT